MTIIRSKRNEGKVSINVTICMLFLRVEALCITLWVSTLGRRLIFQDTKVKTENTNRF